MNGLFDKTIDKLTGLINYRSKRNNLLLSNITNIDTSGYKPSDLEFGDEMKAASAKLTRTDDRHLAGKGGEGDYTVVQKEENVSLDKSMVDLAENQLMHNTAIEMMARKFNSLQTILK
ncbi:MAG: flagellar basal body rod protein FlgB [Syntrophales bacterium]|nr:flagellar basal body rod protein FlgB [Syntrophales bacterium]